MTTWRFYSPDQLRAMYASGHGDATAQRLSRKWAAIIACGLMPRRWVTLQVAGRKSGRPVQFPLGMADWDGQWYLVPMLGERCNWVRNVRAAEGHVTLRNGRAVRCRLVELPVEARPPIIKRYLTKVPGGRPHIPVDRSAPLAEFARIAAAFPVFLVVPQSRSFRLRAPRSHARRQACLPQQVKS